MPKQTTEMENRNVTRMSNQDAKKLSQECIETALISLMKKKAFEEITISEIVRKAGVSRAAFYRNYSSKQEVLRDSCIGAIQDVADAIDTVSFYEDQTAYWRTLFTVAQKYADSFLLLLQAGFGHVILEEITHLITERLPEQTTEDRYDMAFWCGAVYNLLTTWISEGMVESIEEMSKIGTYIVRGAMDPKTLMP